MSINQRIYMLKINKMFALMLTLAVVQRNMTSMYLKLSFGVLGVWNTYNLIFFTLRKALEKKQGQVYQTDLSSI